MNQVLELIATFTAGLFCGAALYINLVEHPARMSCGTPLAVTEFAPGYNRATVLQVSLAAGFIFEFVGSVVHEFGYLLAYWGNSYHNANSIYAHCHSAYKQ
jgi:hypothetical protein